MKVSTFIKRYNGKVLEDWGVGLSDEFKKFARDFKSVIKDIIKDSVPEIEIVDFKIGHYDMYGFLKDGDKYIYFGYSPMRNTRLNLKAKDCFNAILVRTAESEKDYHGGQNNFCNIEEFKSTMYYLFRF